VLKINESSSGATTNEKEMHAWSVSLACNKILKPISVCGSSSSGIHSNVATTMGLTN